MKNLMTRKHVLCMLLGFVLAFGVQGTVDAATLGVSGDTAVTSTTRGTAIIDVADIGDTTANRLIRSFTLRVTGADDNDAVTFVIVGDAEITNIETTSAPGRPSNTNVADGTNPTPAKDDTLSSSALITASVIDFDGLGFRNFGENNAAANTGNWTFKVTYKVTDLGFYSIDAYIGTADTIPDIAAYVVQSKSKANSYVIDKTDNITSTPQNPPTAPQRTNTPMAVRVTNGTNGQEWVQVDLRITNGKLDPTGMFLSSGRIYGQNDANDAGYTSLSVFTDSDGDIDVNVRPDNGRTATVTAQISGVSRDETTHTVTYFDEPVKIERVSGNYQHGLTNQTLSQSLVVRVSDDGRPVRDQRVRFTASDAGIELTANPLSSFINETGSVERSNVISVMTDSRGEAKVDLRLPDTPNQYTVNAIVSQTPPPGNTPLLDELGTNDQFQVFAVRDASDVSGLTINTAITTQTPVENARSDRNPIVVDFEGTSAAWAEVDFSITGGQLFLQPELQDLDRGSLDQTLDKPRYVTQLRVAADANGVAGANDSVLVRVNSGIAVVTVKAVGDSNAKHVVTYIIGEIQIQKVSGDRPYEEGAPGGLRDNPFVVKVTADGSPAAGQIVRFTLPTGTEGAGAVDRKLVPTPGTKVFVTFSGGFTLDTTDDPRPASASVAELVHSGDLHRYTLQNTIFVETDSQGEAKVHLQMGSGINDHVVTARIPVGNPTAGVSFTVKPKDSDVPGKLKKLEIPADSDPNGPDHDSDNERETLAVYAENDDGARLPGVNIRFNTSHGRIRYLSGHGTLSSSTPDTPGISSGEEIFVQTDFRGEAWVTYVKDEDISSQTATADVTNEQGAGRTYTFEVSLVTFNIGSGGTTSDPQTGTPPTRNVDPYLSISVSPTRGPAGTTGTITVDAFNEDRERQSNIPVTLSAAGITFSPNPVPSGTSATFTFPSSGSPTITATANEYDLARSTITVTEPEPETGPTGTPVASTLAIVSGNSQVVKTNQDLDPFVVEVKDQTGDAMSGVEVLFQTAGAGTLSSSKVPTGSNGQASSTLSLPTTQAAFRTYTVYATVIGVEGLQQQFTVIARKPVLSHLEVGDENPQTAYVGERLEDPLEVQVLDTDDDPVEGIQVTFTILSDESTGTATPLTQSAESDAGGYAGIHITPEGAGEIQIQASVTDLTPVQLKLTASLPPSQLVIVSGDDQNGGPSSRLKDAFVVEVRDENGNPVAGIPVSFEVTAGGGSVSVRSSITDTNGQAQTILTLGKARGRNTVEASAEGVSATATFAAISGAQVRVAAAQRPALYWIDTKAGTLQRLVDTKVESIARNIRNATNIVVDAADGKIYWTAQPKKNVGRIWRANLNGTNPEKLRDITSTLMGLTLDAANSTIYWTNSRGRIQSMSTSGGKITNVLQNRPKPGPIVFSGGVLYWGEAGGEVRRMSLTARQKVTTSIADNAGEPMGIAVGKGKVYWTEKTSGKAGRIRRANLNGSNVQNVKALSSIPIGIGVDADNNKIYWTNSRGRIQRSSLVGGKIQNVVTDLVSPGALALDMEAVDDEPAVQQPTQQTQRQAQQTDDSKYDVNDDGTVNNIDLTLVAIALGSDNMQYDVNGDGVVNADDVRAVSDAINDAAAAPAMIDIDLKTLDIDFDRVQEQIQMLIAAGDLSIESQRVLRYLQHLLASARPHETVLLANYPNPFNPETWIPYHLADSTDVKVNIYNAQGILVRALTLGHQSAGYYTSRSRAAYWDGRNALGERVASGIYFYQLQTDEISPMRKMVILK